MRTIGFLIQKEFLQIFRNRSMLPIIFAVPVVQLIIIVHAATFEMKSIRLFVVDHDRSVLTREVCDKFRGSGFFRITGYSDLDRDGEQGMKQREADAIVVFPADFEKQVSMGRDARFQLIVNAINGSAGGLIHAYTQSVVQDMNHNLRKESGLISMETRPQQIDLTYTFWYNPELNYQTFMVPGILVILVTVISLLLSGMNIVKEKEIGTIEQVNVSPIRKYQFIAGKLIPTLLIALFELAFGLGVGKLLFDIPLEGNLLLVFFAAAVYSCVILGLGLLVSTMTGTQQQAMFVSFFFMIVFILMSGLFTAAENMPDWAQWLNHLNPVAYFIRIIRMVLLKGSGFTDIRPDLFALALLAVLSITLAVRRYRKTV
ncbi:MAG TPA: ABC transporter permease [Bacteroidales bacterium]|nr:ABC transporter permease [Bacteroidales bacterium]HSA42226.1 ABC transporter permease [Bacteroidales bacterium]